MARTQTVDDEALIARLACVFRESGYVAASLAALSQAAGLKRASLYHRFPGGKRQMAEEVLAAALDWLGEHVVAPLRGAGAPAERLAAATAAIDRFYDSGSQACLLNMLSAPRGDGPFESAIKSAFRTLIDALAALARDAGFPAADAAARAERVVMLLQGSLVLSRGLGSRKPFRAFLASLPAELLTSPHQSTG